MTPRRAARMRMVPVVLSLVAGLCARSAAADNLLPPHERQALIALYNATHGDEWRFNTGWLGPPGTECNWFGIDCWDQFDPARRFARVETIDLTDNFLRGTLPRRIGNFARLQYLILPNNQLTGPLPTELGKLTELLWLNLDLNRFTGTIPAELGNLRHLEWLSLTANRLAGSLPSTLAQLRDVAILDVADNDLTGKIPEWLGSLTNLHQLALSRNRLTGPIPAQLFELPWLTSLGLGDNRLSGRLPAQIGQNAGQQQYLGLLGIDGNRLEGPIPPGIVGLRELDSFNLNWNALHTDDPAVVAFIDARSSRIGWRIIQTLAPEDISAAPAGPDSVRLTWAPVNYHPDRLNAPGGYEIAVRSEHESRFRRHILLARKDRESFTVTGLEPGTVYFFRISTFSLPHEENKNTVRSGWSPAVRVTTLTR